MESIKPRIGSTDSSHSGFCSTPSIPKSRSKPGMPDALMTSLAKRFEARKRLVEARAPARTYARTDKIRERACEVEAQGEEAVSL